MVLRSDLQLSWITGKDFNSSNVVLLCWYSYDISPILFMYVLQHLYFIHLICWSFLSTVPIFHVRYQKMPFDRDCEKGYDSSLRHHTHVNTGLLHCCFDSRASTVRWPAGVPLSAVSPSSQSSLSMWAGVWLRQSAAHSCSHSTKASMWHLTAMPDDRRMLPQAPEALPFKMWRRGPCHERRHLSLCQLRVLASFFPPTRGLLSVRGW